MFLSRRWRSRRLRPRCLTATCAIFLRFCRRNWCARNWSRRSTQNNCWLKRTFRSQRRQIFRWRPCLFQFKTFPESRAPTLAPADNVARARRLTQTARWAGTITSRRSTPRTRSTTRPERCWLRSQRTRYGRGAEPFVRATAAAIQSLSTTRWQTAGS